MAKRTKAQIDAYLLREYVAREEDLPLFYSIAAGDEDEDAPAYFSMSTAQECADAIKEAAAATE